MVTAISLAIVFTGSGSFPAQIPFTPEVQPPTEVCFMGGATAAERRVRELGFGCPSGHNGART